MKNRKSIAKRSSSLEENSRHKRSSAMFSPPPFCPCSRPFVPRYLHPSCSCLPALTFHLLGRDRNVKKAKRRIYGLKDEGRQLDSATVELEARLEDCRSKLDRIVQVRMHVFCVSRPSTRHFSLVASIFASFCARPCRVLGGEGTGPGASGWGRVWSTPPFSLGTRRVFYPKYGAVACVP